MEINKIDYNAQKELLKIVYKMLINSYSISTDKSDPTALIVSGITEKEHREFCAVLGCSGHYSDVSQCGVILNFGMFN